MHPHHGGPLAPHPSAQLNGHGHSHGHMQPAQSPGSQKPVGVPGIAQKVIQLNESVWLQLGMFFSVSSLFMFMFIFMFIFFLPFVCLVRTDVVAVC